MGTIHTLRGSISRLRGTFRKVHELGLKVSKEKLEAEIVLEGRSVRFAKELINTFIKAEEVFEETIDGRKVLVPNPKVYGEEDQKINEEVKKVLNA